VKQLNKLIPVIKITELASEEGVERELMLVTVRASAIKRKFRLRPSRHPRAREALRSTDRAYTLALGPPAKPFERRTTSPRRTRLSS